MKKAYGDGQVVQNPTGHCGKEQKANFPNVPFCTTVFVKQGE